MDDLIVVGMNGLFETEKKSIWRKAFPISQKSSGMRNIKQKTERVFMVDFLPLPPCRQVTSCSSKPSSGHSEVSVFKQWRTIAGKGSRRRGRHHFSARFRLPNADIYLSSDPLCSQQTEKLSTLMFGWFIPRMQPNCC